MIQAMLDTNILIYATKNFQEKFLTSLATARPV